jgi:hypothetical protein
MQNTKVNHGPNYRLFGFPNPFQPGGSLSEDADLIVRMLKEGRLAEMSQQTDLEQEDIEH